MRKHFGLVLFRIVNNSRTRLGDDLCFRVKLKIFNMHIGTYIRAERAVVYLMGAVVLQPFEHVSPFAVHSCFYGGSDNKRNLLGFHKLHNGFKIVIVVSCAVLAVLNAFAALDTLVGIDMNHASVISVCVRNWTYSYAGVAAYTFVFNNVYHIENPFRLILKNIIPYLKKAVNRFCYFSTLSQ